jgi:hypothetical protein
MNLPGFTAARAFEFSAGPLNYAAGERIGLGKLSFSIKSMEVNQLVVCTSHAQCGRRKCCYRQDAGPNVCRPGPCNL